MKSKISHAFGQVTSDDGTLIGYQSFGSGPGVILVEGAMGTAENYHDLALAMSSRFKVYVPDRRGRGMSPRAYRADHAIRDDVEDVRCLLEHTGARYLFGLSSGAMIVLEALKVGLPVDRAAVFEPPFYLQGMATHLIPRFNRQVERNHFAAALVTAMRIVGLGPKLLRFVPGWILQLGAAYSLRNNARHPTSYAPLKELIPAMQYDFNVVATMNERMQSLRTLDMPVLLMGGDKSPDYLKDAIVALKKIIANAKSVELADADHSGPWNKDLHGKPQAVADAMAAFFLSGSPAIFR